MVSSGHMFECVYGSIVHFACEERWVPPIDLFILFAFQQLSLCFINTSVVHSTGFKTFSRFSFEISFVEACVCVCVCVCVWCV